MNNILKTLNFIAVCSMALRGAISMKPLWFDSPIIEGLVIGIPLLIINGLYFFRKPTANDRNN
jgi:hypothetical protein